MFLAAQASTTSSVRSRSEMRAKSRHMPRYHGMKLESLQHTVAAAPSPTSVTSVNASPLMSRERENKPENGSLLPRPQPNSRTATSTNHIAPLNITSKVDPANATASVSVASRRSTRNGSRRRLKRTLEDEPLPEIPSVTTRPIGQRDDLDVTLEENENSGCCSIRGLKPGHPNWTNQDNFLILERPEGRPDIRLFIVLDGHGEHGHLVSRKCRDSFPTYLRKTNYDLRRSCTELQDSLVFSNEVDVRCSGATCIMVMVIGNTLQIANLGDSRAVLGRRQSNGTMSAIPLSYDHKPDRPDEKKRITSCGGHVGCRQVIVSQGVRGPVTLPMGPARVWYHFRGETLGLAMSRSLGDGLAHKSGVSAEAELSEQIIDVSDEFLILATDGVWDVVDNNQAVQLIQNFSARQQMWSPHEAAMWLCRFARSRWEKMSPMVDDITCIVVRLKKP